MNSNQIKELMGTWANYTYEDGLKRCHEIELCSDTELKQTSQILTNLGLIHKHMNGESVMGFNFYEKEDLPIRFTEIFETTLRTRSPVTNQASLSPASYILNIVKFFNKLGCFRDDYIEKILPRGLRAFPSFIRELDLGIKLKENIEGSFCRRGSPGEDMSDHTDLYLNYNGVEYHIWSYLQTLKPDKIANTVSKIRGERGDITRGHHILCPITINNKSTYCGWWLYPKSYINTIKNIIDQNLIDNYFSIIRNSNLQSYVQEPHIFVK